MRKDNYSDLPTLYHYFVDGSGTTRWRREAVTRLNLSDCLDIYTATYNDPWKMICWMCLPVYC